MEYLIGDIELFSFGFEPAYWMVCGGQTLSITTYEASIH